MSIFATSTSAFFERSTQNLTALRGQAEALQNQISSNSKLTKSSDDPLAASMLRGLARQEALAMVDTAAADRAIVDLDLTDTALSQFATYVTRAQELATQAASSLLPRPSGPPSRPSLGRSTTAFWALPTPATALAMLCSAVTTQPMPTRSMPPPVLPNVLAAARRASSRSAMASQSAAR